MIPLDTSLEADRAYRRTLRRLGPARRLQMAFDLCATMRSLVESGIRQRHPEFDDRQVRRAVAERILGHELPLDSASDGAWTTVSDQHEFLFGMIDRLRRCGIPYMLTGSFAGTIFGEPRTTNDVDLVVDPTAEQLEAFLDTVRDEEYVSREAAREALRTRGMFNVIDTASGWKVDLIVRKDRPFSVEEFGRRVDVEWQGRSLQAASPEDVILSKLEWHRRSGSERQLADAAAVVATQGDDLDRGYLRRWAAELDRLLGATGD